MASRATMRFLTENGILNEIKNFLCTPGSILIFITFRLYE
ncbi:hypothetical protein NT01EI_3300 [Edwardsiella ictaluri 93-146]|uniref:Uncharacterized protein n=1 Tax=Edwardsiella ictaluri (strain 93-146) TaxID=634503 RepID=C5B911_EDWI9|nr:hypothetical protein NT01EI_3300 [Edwardsiella ictaluri 93-146]